VEGQKDGTTSARPLPLRNMQQAAIEDWQMATAVEDFNRPLQGS
jgi:hypothetical protein